MPYILVNAALTFLILHSSDHKIQRLGLKKPLPIGPSPTRVNDKTGSNVASEGFQARCPGCTGMRKDSVNVPPTQHIPQRQHHKDRFCPGCTGMRKDSGYSHEFGHI